MKIAVGRVFVKVKFVEVVVINSTIVLSSNGSAEIRESRASA